ncbi:7TM diverse intracellular signaling domain-containing protein [Reichenbachiella versicolor]|uniref:7TM diverse intracellular signaling domain-containing protein n=1 Tax=Reichenbachiella versicolor TaxID=1821036 RepID=UPI000D6DCDE3|nr:7TM diverse intracellular signaling domain-containing protein [Reichenbachiella versicolor]
MPANVKLPLAILLIVSTFNLLAQSQFTDSHFSFFEIAYLDTSNELSIQEIIDRPESSTDKKITLTEVKSDCWIRIKLKTLENGTSKYLLEVGEPALKHIDFYSVKNRTVQEHFQSGISIPFEDRQEQYRNHVFPITSQDSTLQVYYLYITTNGNRSISPLSFQTEEEYQKKNLIQTLELGVGIGLLFIVCLISIVLFVLFKKKIYLLYFFHLAFVILFILSRSGLGFLYLWACNPDWNPFMMRMSLYGLIAFISLFTIYFLRVRTFSKVLTSLLYADALLHVFLILAVFLGIDLANLPKVPFSSFLHTTLLITVGVFAMRANLKQAGFYTVGIVLFSLIGIIHILALYGVTPVFFSKFIVLRFAWYVEVFFLTIGVAYNFKRVILENKQLLATNRLTEYQLRNAKGTIDKVEQEIEKRDRKLLSSNMEVTKRIDELTTIKDEVEDVKVRKKLDQLITNQYSENSGSNWEDFKLLFEQIHPSFFERINNEYPKLTQSDLRFVAYVKMGLSSKEIASLLNVQVDSLKNTRYRIRKKIGLDPSVKVNDFFLRY